MLIMESMDKLGYYFNVNEYQRQTYISNYLDGRTDHNDIYSKGKTTMNDIYTYEQIQDQTMHIKPASVANSNHHQLSRTFQDWSPSSFPRYEFPNVESAHTYTMEQTPQSCMYPNTRGCYEHYVNHARSQLHWIRDLSQGRAHLVL